MSELDLALLEILRIGHVTSIRSEEGLSLKAALARAKYNAVRHTIDRNGVLAALQAHPQFIQEWVMYSEDKRTTGGWYIKWEELEIGRLEFPRRRLKFGTIEETVAEYVLRELDYWAKVASA